MHVSEASGPGDFADIESLFQRVWSTAANRPPINAHVLRALAHSGSYVALARDDGGEISGAAVGFLARDDSVSPAAASLHSHITAVTPGLERHGIGRMLKLHQRDFARRHELASITWTFDPLVRRNAAFNCSLGVDLVAYHIDFYGDMDDAVNVGQGSDRLVARWDVTAPVLPRTATDPTPGEAGALDRDALGGPALRAVTGERTWVAIPHDIEAVRAADPAQGRAWRLAVRDTLGHLLGTWHIEGFTPDGRYALRRNAAGLAGLGLEGGG